MVFQRCCACLLSVVSRAERECSKGLLSPAILTMPAAARPPSAAGLELEGGGGSMTSAGSGSLLLGLDLATCC